MLENVTVNEHASIRIKGKKVIYFDPFKIKEELHDADVIFVTHSHYDHYSSEDIKKVSNENTILVVPESMLDKVTENNVLAVKPNTEVKILGLYVLGISAAMALGRIIFRLFLFKASTSIGQGLRDELFEKATDVEGVFYVGEKKKSQPFIFQFKKTPFKKLILSILVFK